MAVDVRGVVAEVQPDDIRRREVQRIRASAPRGGSGDHERAWFDAPQKRRQGRWVDQGQVARKQQHAGRALRECSTDADLRSGILTGARVLDDVDTGGLGECEGSLATGDRDHSVAHGPGRIQCP